MIITNIFIVRHGETEYNRKNQIQGRGIDAPLNETGRKQAEAVARYFNQTNIDHIFSSSLKRSMETAEIIAESRGVGYRSYSELDEMNYGIIEGRSVSEIQKELTQLSTAWQNGDVEYALENGESPLAVYNRVSKRMRIILENHAPSNLVFVLHGRLIRIILSEWLGLGLHSMHRIEHSNGALYHLKWDGSNYSSVKIHYTGHLNGYT